MTCDKIKDSIAKILLNEKKQIVTSKKNKKTEKKSTQSFRFFFVFSSKFKLTFVKFGRKTYFQICFEFSIN